jgi:hypothetical protein
MCLQKLSLKTSSEISQRPFFDVLLEPYIEVFPFFCLKHTYIK